jgi:DNA-directed RNA polymerase subunit M/transcription elongation factor TFIIS
MQRKYEINMEINRKLEHLTEEQIEEVITMYKDKSIRLSNIISKYNIDVKPSGLLSILPPIKTDEVCAICGAYLYQKLKPRTGYASDSQKDKFCLECGHWVYAKSIWETKKCTCEGCKAIAKAEEERKKKQIQEIYSKEKAQINFTELTLSDQIKLVYVLMNNSFHNVSEIAPMEPEGKWIQYINRLTEIKAISVSPESAVNAFCKENFPNEYYVAKVQYNVNVIFDDEILYKINNNSYFIENSNEEELIILLKKYIYDDLIRQFEDMLNSRRLQLHISENANDKFIELIDKISYTQILTLCNRVAVFFSDKVLTGNMSKSMAKNAALLNVSKFYDRAIQSDWTINHAEICHIGKELQFFIERILNKKTTILKDIASAENLRKWKNLEKDYNRQTAYAEE